MPDHVMKCLMTVNTKFLELQAIWDHTNTFYSICTGSTEGQYSSLLVLGLGKLQNSITYSFLASVKNDERFLFLHLKIWSFGDEKIQQKQFV